METDRRSFLKLTAAAALATAVSPIEVGASDKEKHATAPSGNLPTVVVINGSFGLVIPNDPKSQLMAFAPDISDHRYRLDAKPLPKGDLNVVTVDSKWKPIKGYAASINFFSPDESGFVFDPSVGSYLRIYLPHPQQIYAHRLIDAVVKTSTDIGPFVSGCCGAVALVYAPGSAPAVNQLPEYVPDCCGPYYRMVFAAESTFMTDTEASILAHAQEAWDGLKAHFTGMDWSLYWPQSTKPPAAADPLNISDSDIEGAYYPCPPLPRSAKPRGKQLDTPNDCRQARAANCKTPLFLTTG